MFGFAVNVEIFNTQNMIDAEIVDWSSKLVDSFLWKPWKTRPALGVGQRINRLHRVVRRHGKRDIHPVTLHENSRKQIRNVDGYKKIRNKHIEDMIYGHHIRGVQKVKLQKDNVKIQWVMISLNRWKEQEQTHGKMNQIVVNTFQEFPGLFLDQGGTQRNGDSDEAPSQVYNQNQRGYIKQCKYLYKGMQSGT